MVSNSSKALIVSNSGKRFDQSGKKKYVRQVTGRHNDTELHLAAQKGDVMAVIEILGEIDEQMLKTLRGAEFDAGVAEIREAVVNEVNELGETALFIAAEKGFIYVMKELLPYSTREGIRTKNRSGFDPLHIAASRGHHGNPTCFITWFNSLIWIVLRPLILGDKMSYHASFLELNWFMSVE